KETRVEAILGAGDRVEMFWTPRTKRVTEMAASVFAQSTSLVTVGGGAVNTRTIVDYQIAQGELRQAKLRLPGDQRLLRVEGEWIRTWELKDEDKVQILTVELLKDVSPAYRLTVETEKVLDKLPAQVKVEVPHVMEVIRETGLVGLRGTEEISLAVENAADLQRVDAALEFKLPPAPRETQSTAPPDKLKLELQQEIIAAYRFLKSGFQLTARAESVQPQIEAVVRNTARIGFEEIAVASQVDYAIKKAGVFGLKLALPAGYKVDSVSGGDRVQQWTEKNNPRVLEVALKERTLGGFTLFVNLSKAHKELTNTVEIVGVHPQETQKLTGFVSVSAEPGVAVKTAAFDGLTEIPAAALPDGVGAGGGVLAFKFISGSPQAAATWKLNVATETVGSWVRAEVANLVTVTETLMSGRTLVRYDIQNAPMKEFRLKVPAAYTNVEVLGTNIRRRDQTGEVWRVELQNKVRGTFLLTVTWEKPRDAKTNAPVEVPGLEALGVERETGSIAILAKPPLQVSEKSATEQLLKIDARELPDWAGTTTGAPVLVYRYLRPGYKLSLDAKRFGEAALLQALVDNAHLTTVIADDGQMMTEMVLGVRNNGLQLLEIELPKDSKVWSAFVGGQPVRPSLRAGKLMLPLERSGADDAAVSVSLTYVGAETFPRGKGSVELVSPRLDVPLKNVRWELYLPPDYSYTKFKGSMTHEEDAAPAVQVYSSQDYFRKEEVAKLARQSEMKSFLSKARKDLASGNVKEANDEFSNAIRNNWNADAGTKQELEGLKRDLGRVQGSNLIQSQSRFTVDNTSKYGGQLPQQTQAGAAGKPGEQSQQVLQYDAEVAERQWGALQRAQEVKVATVRPLRVNLPTRGLRHVFTQVLQTEVQKPMTIQFKANNEKAVSWTKRVGLGLFGFFALWGIVAVTAKPKRSNDEDGTRRKDVVSK
ncbi:MAG TPA: hypothetical protein VFA77_11335, partial [Candidatus Eisenbacteria bacterium]|nr:hypothetical protein [Candidatus Eisenbacteria bacterium]